MPRRLATKTSSQTQGPAWLNTILLCVIICLIVFGNIRQHRNSDDGENDRQHERDDNVKAGGVLFFIREKQKATADQVEMLENISQHVVKAGLEGYRDYDDDQDEAKVFLDEAVKRKLIPAQTPESTPPPLIARVIAREIFKIQKWDVTQKQLDEMSR
jgi:hypothetical protein